MPEASFLDSKESMVFALEKLAKAAEARPVASSEAEDQWPAEYRDLHFLLIAMPWGLFDADEKYGLLSRFGEGSTYGWGIASTAGKILKK
jgi:hypothetical protein